VHVVVSLFRIRRGNGVRLVWFLIDIGRSGRREEVSFEMAYN